MRESLMKILHHLLLCKEKAALGVLLAASLLPGTASAAYSASTDTAADILDYIENERRAAKENRLTEAQQELLKDTEDMRQHLRQPIDPAAKNLPASFEGDDLLYDQVTGEFLARGNVKITEIDNRRVTSDEIKGNMISQDVRVENKAHLIQLTPGQTSAEIDGWKLAYNYGTGIGTIEDAQGRVAHQYISGKKIEIYPDKIVIHDGTATKCSAKQPDYHTSAKLIEIYPNDKAIFHDCDFWVKKMRVAHRNRYEADLSPNKKESSPFPRVSYDKDSGFIIRQEFGISLADHLEFVPLLQIATNEGVRSNAELRYDAGFGRFRLGYGYWQDDNDNWLKREPSLRYNYSWRVDDLPVSWGIEAERGRWHNNDFKSTHTHWKFSLTPDAIPLGENFNLYLNTSYSVTKESYNDSKVAGVNWTATLLKKFDDRFTAYAKYDYAQNSSQNSLFDYDVADYNKAVYSGFSYQLTDNDRFVCGIAYDVDSHSLRDVDYYWYHDMHCVQLIARYREKRDRWTVKLNFTPW